MATRQTCDIQEGDREWVKEFEKNLCTLTGLVEEVFEEHKAMLLSPVMREMVRDHGRKVAEQIQKVQGRIVIDNPGKTNLFGSPFV